MVLIIIGQLYNYSSRMEELLSTLRYVENYLTTISSGAMKDIFNVGFAVKEIETNSATTRTEAQNALQVYASVLMFNNVINHSPLSCLACYSLRFM